MNGVIISISVPLRVCRRFEKLELPGGKDIPPYHVTVAYLGKMDQISDRIRRQLISIVHGVCRRHPPMLLKIGGFGVFNPSESSDGKSILHYEMDSPGLAELHTDLIRDLSGFLPIRQDHGFVPHITVGYLPEGKRSSNFKIPSMQYPDWVVQSVEVVFGGIPVEIPLGGDLWRSMGHDMIPAPVVFTLRKGRTKGSKNKVRRYLMRLELPGKDRSGNPRYEYVYPDEDEVESFHPTLGYVLKPKPGEEKPRTISQIVNDRLFGSYGVHRIKDKKTGKELNEPFWQDGLFFAYEPRMSTDHLKRKYGTPIDMDTIGRVRFYKYRKLAGYLSVDLGPGVERKYSLPQKVANLHLTDPENIRQAEALTPGYSGPPVKIGEGKNSFVIHGIQEGAEPSENQPKYVTDSGPAGEINIHVVPEESEQTQNALSEPITDKVDPIAYAQRAIERARKKKLPKTSTDKVKKIDPFPQWAIDRFDSEKELVEELRDRPATTLVTLGKYNPKAIHSQLLNEWKGVINGLARDMFRWTYRMTVRYKQREDEDRSAGFEAGGGPGLRAYRKQVMDDLIQQGKLEMLALTKEYSAKEEKPGRFDSWVYSRLKGRLQDYSKEQAQHYEGGVPEHILEEHEIDEAARHQGYTVEMSPEEAAELHDIRRKARVALLKVLHDKRFPEAYRRVFTARLYLDSPESVKLEADTIDKRREHVGSKKELGFQPRPFTGPGGIATMYPEWTDLKGKKIIMSDLNPNAQLYYLQKWYQEAQQSIYRKFSKPTVDVDGDVNEEDRVLTSSGKIVKEWLNLESKLAEGNRRLYEDRERHEKIVVHEPIHSTGPVRPPKPPEPAIHKPAVSFFVQHPELAAKLGVEVDKLDLASGMHQGTQAEHHFKIAERYHNTLLEVKNHSPQKLVSRIGATTQAVDSLRKLHDHHIDKLHSAVQDYQRHTRRLGEAAEKLREDKRAYARTRHVAELSPKNPFNKKEDLVGWEAFQHLSKLGGIKHIAEVDAGIRHYIENDSDYVARGKVLTQFVNNIKREMVKVGAIKLGEDPAKIAAFKARAQAIKDDPEHAKAKQNARMWANKVAAVKVGEVPVGAAIVQSYVQAFQGKTPITSEHLAPHKAQVHSALRSLEGELELLKFEQDSRRVKKSGDPGFDLLKAFRLFDVQMDVLKNDQPHHRAYTRRSKSGKVSQIQAKGEWQKVATEPKLKQGGKPAGAAGSQLPEDLRDRLQKLGVSKLPAAHIADVHVHDRTHDDDQAHSGALLKWKDDKGKVQTTYTTEFDRRNADKKWERVLASRSKVESKMDKLRSEAVSDPAAAAALLIALTGLRPGSSLSERTTGHYGATTMQCRHVTFDGEEAHIKYVGKAGKLNQATITDASLVSALHKLIEGKDPNDRVFNVRKEKIAEKTPKGVKLKDLRTILATSSAESLLKGYTPKLSEKTGDIKKDAANEKADARKIIGILKAVSTAVSKQLNNTPAMARRSYIAPQVIRAWGESHGIRSEWLE